MFGTLIEIGIATVDPAAPQASHDAAFATLAALQACLSRFEDDSDIARFNALPAGASLTVRPDTRAVLTAADELRQASAGLFDISVGSGPDAWCLDGDRLHKLDDRVRLDLGGIGKGYAVDCAVQLLVDRRIDTGWVNAGGDLRVFGDIDLPIHVRDESAGGVRPFATLHDGAFATSCFGAHARAQLATGRGSPAPLAHVSVAAPRCLWADALTKIVAISGDVAHPLLARHGAQAWQH